jgi:DNA-directed RNA polymerase subunit beta'
MVININNGASSYFKILKAILKETDKEEYKAAIEDKMRALVREAESDAGQNHGIDFNDYNFFIASVSDVRIGTGAETIKKMIEDLDINKEIRSIKAKLQTKQSNNTLYRRLRVLTSFKESGQDPSTMIMDVIPVIPPDLRPLIQLDGGRHSTVDVNELYRRVIIRNNRLEQ